MRNRRNTGIVSTAIGASKRQTKPSWGSGKGRQALNIHNQTVNKERFENRNRRYSLRAPVNLTPRYESYTGSDQNYIYSDRDLDDEARIEFAAQRLQDILDKKKRDNLIDSGKKALQRDYKALVSDFQKQGLTNREILDVLLNASQQKDIYNYLARTAFSVMNKEMIREDIALTDAHMDSIVQALVLEANGLLHALRAENKHVLDSRKSAGDLCVKPVYAAGYFLVHRPLNAVDSEASQGLGDYIYQYTIKPISNYLAEASKIYSLAECVGKCVKIKFAKSKEKQIK